MIKDSNIKAIISPYSKESFVMCTTDSLKEGKYHKLTGKVIIDFKNVDLDLLLESIDDYFSFVLTEGEEIEIED